MVIGFHFGASAGSLLRHQRDHSDDAAQGHMM